jgi:dipeptidyl aminopeptidase/acylaminoacyl peptidase
MALMDNNLLDWTPVAPITLFHGTEDDYVYPLNSQNAFDQLSQNGGELEYIRIEGKNHQDAAIPFFFEALNRIHNKE